MTTEEYQACMDFLHKNTPPVFPDLVLTNAQGILRNISKPPIMSVDPDDMSVAMSWHFHAGDKYIGVWVWVGLFQMDFSANFHSQGHSVTDISFRDLKWRLGVIFDTVDELLEKQKQLGI